MLDSTQQPSRMCFTCHATKPADDFSRSKPNHCKACRSASARKYYQDNPQVRERVKGRSKAYHHANRESRLAALRARDAETRAAAMQVYGGQCARCDATEGLEFDHTEGGGTAHRRHENNQSMMRRIVRTGSRLPDVELQLLCRDHHGEKTSAERRSRTSRRA